MDGRSEFHPTLDELDRDGALRESAERVDGHTRAAFMRRTGAFLGGTLMASALPLGTAIAQGATGKSDVAILNYALTLEFLESAFYAEAVSKGALSGETKTFARVVADHESQHVAALKKALGSKATKKPSFDFKGTTASQSTFQQTAMVLEDTGVKAYLGQVGNIKSKDVLGAAGSILPIEARHAAWIAEIIGHGSSPSPAPEAFQSSADIPTVLAAVKSTGFVTSMIAAPPGAPVTGQPSTAG